MCSFRWYKFSNKLAAYKAAQFFTFQAFLLLQLAIQYLWIIPNNTIRVLTFFKNLVLNDFIN